jgi:hypothetical protein
MTSRVAIALVHHPVLDRRGAVVTTAITNLDLHDIARSACTYALGGLWVVHPVEAQRELARRVRAHWVGGSGARRIPERQPALELLRIVSTLEDAIEQHGAGSAVELWATSARSGEGRLGFPQARQRLGEPGPPVLLLFGTGWGLAPELLVRADQHLAPVESPVPGGYNHLSVRAAAAIILDRLLGAR